MEYARSVRSFYSRVASDIIRADTEIGNLEALDAMHVQALVNDTVLDDAVTLPRGH